jgi:hypothetical protein
MTSADVAPYLWLCTALLVLRVVGQIIVVVAAPRWLPPMQQWQSGLLPYPVLLIGQVLVLFLMFAISTDFTRGRGWWVEAHPALGRAAVYWSCVYLTAMVVRYIVRMSRRPDQRWFGGTIPIVFHSIVAVFQFIFGVVHMRA